MAAARDGDTDALGQLLELYRNYLAMIARMQIGPQFQRKFSASDVVQDTFVQAKRRFGDFNGASEGELTAWLREILVSQLAMKARHYTSQRRDVTLERQLQSGVDQSAADIARILPAATSTPSQSAARRESAVVLANALAQLPEHYRTVIVLRHVREMQFTEIAATMQRSTDSVKGLWRRAIGMLRELLADDPSQLR